jgi:hypothetical protein
VEHIADAVLPLGEPLLDRTKPLWLTYVVENVEGKTVLVNMSHHAMVDGATGVDRPGAGGLRAQTETDSGP